MIKLHHWLSRPPESNRDVSLTIGLCISYLALAYLLTWHIVVALEIIRP